MYFHWFSVCVCSSLCVPPCCSTSIILIMFPFFVHFLVLLCQFCLHYCLFPGLFHCRVFLNPVIFLPFPPRPSAAFAALASETKGKMKAFVLQWLCVWCQSGSFFMRVQTVIRVYPFKELLSLTGAVRINHRKSHTYSVVWGRWSTCAPDRGVFKLASVVCLTVRLLLYSCDGSLRPADCSVVY